MYRNGITCPWPSVLAVANSVRDQPQALYCSGSCLPDPDRQSGRWPSEHVSAISEPLEIGNKYQRARTLQTRALLWKLDVLGVCDLMELYSAGFFQAVLCLPLARGSPG